MLTSCKATEPGSGAVCCRSEGHLDAGIDHEVLVSSRLGTTRPFRQGPVIDYSRLEDLPPAPSGHGLGLFHDLMAPIANG